MKAVIVSFIVQTRVLVPDEATDEEAIIAATEKISGNASDYLCSENVEGVMSDMEVPYNPEYDD